MTTVSLSWNVNQALLIGHVGPGIVVALASRDKTARFWDAATGATLRTLEGHPDHVTSVAFLPGCEVVASLMDRTVRLKDAARGAALQTIEGHSNLFNAVASSPDVKVVAPASNQYIFKLWDAATGAALQTFGHSDWLGSVSSLLAGQQGGRVGLGR